MVAMGRPLHRLNSKTTPGVAYGLNGNKTRLTNGRFGPSRFLKQLSSPKLNKKQQRKELQQIYEQTRKDKLKAKLEADKNSPGRGRQIQHAIMSFNDEDREMFPEATEEEEEEEEEEDDEDDEEEEPGDSSDDMVKQEEPSSSYDDTSPMDIPSKELFMFFEGRGKLQFRSIAVQTDQQGFCKREQMQP